MEDNTRSSIGHFRPISIDLDYLATIGTIQAGASDTNRLQERISVMEYLGRYPTSELRAMEVVGDSMAGAGIYPGDMVFCVPIEQVGYQLDSLVAVKVDDHDPIVKRWTERGLVSEYRDRTISERFAGAGEVKIIMTVVWHIRDVHRQR